MAAQRAGVKRFIFVSSAGVLGATSSHLGFSEDAAPCPHNDYTASKLAAEQWLTSAVEPRMGLVVLRPPLVYGAGAPETSCACYIWRSRGGRSLSERCARRVRCLPYGIWSTC